MIFPLDNRTAVALGSTIDHINTPDFDNVLRCVCGHIGDTTNLNFLPPSVVWVKNGESITTDSRITITESREFLDQRRASLLRISNFSLSDAGVYQCIFIDVDSDREVITTTPLRLDTGWCMQYYKILDVTLFHLSPCRQCPPTGEHFTPTCCLESSRETGDRNSGIRRVSADSMVKEWNPI